MRWRCRAAICMRGAISRRWVAARPITLPNGTGTVGRRWVRGWTAVYRRLWCWAVTFMLGAGLPRRAAARPTGLPNGTGAVGRRWVRGWTSMALWVRLALWVRWRCRAVTFMRGASSRVLAAARPLTLPNGTGAVGRRWVRG